MNKCRRRLGQNRIGTLVESVVGAKYKQPRYIDHYAQQHFYNTHHTHSYNNRHNYQAKKRYA